MDHPGFDATVPLSVAQIDRFDWALIYADGQYAERILPVAEMTAIPAHVALLPTSVVSWDAPDGVRCGNTATEGQSDAVRFIGALLARGFRSGHGVCTDYESGVERIAGFPAYANAHGAKLRGAGFVHLPYGTSPTLDVIAEKDGCLLTYWRGGTGEDNLTRYWRQTCPRFGWQWGGTVANADLDIASEQFYRCLRGAVPVEAQSQKFSNGFVSAGGMFQYWLHNGGLPAFGMPISREYDTTGIDGAPTRRQWYERALFEWRAGQWPAQWDILPVLLGDIVRGDPTTTARLAYDASSHQSAFTGA